MVFMLLLVTRVSVPVLLSRLVSSSRQLYLAKVILSVSNPWFLQCVSSLECIQLPLVAASCLFSSSAVLLFPFSFITVLKWLHCGPYPLQSAHQDAIIQTPRPLPAPRHISLSKYIFSVCLGYPWALLPISPLKQKQGNSCSSVPIKCVLFYRSQWTALFWSL